jgi:fibronectin-binding autotransporter adhesin
VTSVRSDAGNGTFTTIDFTATGTSVAINSNNQLNVTGILKSGTGTTTISGVSGNGIRAASNTDFDIRTVAGGTLTISATIGATGVNGLTKSGPGTLNLGGVNTFTGTVRPLEGALNVNNASGLQFATLDMSSAGAGQVFFNQASTLGGLSGGRSLDFGGQAVSVGNNNGSTSYSGILSSGALVKIGTGTLALSGSSSLAAATSINNGTLAIDRLPSAGVASPVGTASAINLGSGTTAGTLRYTGNGDTTNRTINLSGSTGGGTIDASGSGALVITAPVTAADTSKVLTLTGTSTAINSIGLIPNPVTAGSLSVVKDGPGLWRLTSTSSFTGLFTIRDGTVVAAANASPSGQSGVFGWGGAPIVGDAGATGTAALLAESGVTIYGVTVATGAGNQAVLIGGAGTSGTATYQSGGNLALGSNVALVAAGDGVVSFASPWVSGSGSGTPTVDVAIGAAGYTGTVRLLATGTLATGGAIGVRYGTAVLGATTILDGAGSLSIDAGATLAGIGTVAGPLGGAGLVAPGNSPGILTAEAFDASGGLSLAFEFTGTSAPNYASASNSLNDVLRLTGTAPFLTSTLGAGNVVNVYLPASVAGGDVFLGGFFADNGGSFTSLIQNATYNYWVAGSGTHVYNSGTYVPLATIDPAWSVNVGTVQQTTSGTFANGDQVNGTVSTFTVVVPEPAAVALAAIGVAMAGYAVHRRRPV